MELAKQIVMLCCDHTKAEDGNVLALTRTVHS